MVKLAQQVCDAAIATYQQREKDMPFLDDLLQSQHRDKHRDKYRDDCIFIISWGFHIPKLVKKLRGYNVVYRAHSAGYGFRLPADIPILTVSRNTLGYWGEHAMNGLVYWLPNHIADPFQNQGGDRTIDVLVQTRKSSDYLLTQLIPALEPRCRVMVLDHYVEDLPGLFNRAKVYLYDSAEYWSFHRLTEGFGLPPMEALACGCQVFSSVNGALADYLDPGFNCHKIAAYSTAFDVERILAVVNTPATNPVNDDFFTPYRTESIVKRLQIILPELNVFFDHRRSHPSDIPTLGRVRRLQLLLRQVRRKLRSR